MAKNSRMHALRSLPCQMLVCRVGDNEHEHSAGDAGHRRRAPAEGIAPSEFDGWLYRGDGPSLWSMTLGIHSMWVPR